MECTHDSETESATSTGFVLFFINQRKNYRWPNIYQTFPKTFQFHKTNRKEIYIVTQNAQNKCKKKGKHSGRTGTDYIHELVKYRINTFTPPKFMKLNGDELQYVRKIFQVVSPPYLKY